MFTVILAFLLAIPAAVMFNTEPVGLQTDLPADITVSASNSVVVNGPINYGLPPGRGTNTDDTLAELYLAAQQNKERVTILIDSPGGGYTQSAELLLKYMDYLVDNGTAVRCVIAGKAYSLAAIIFSHCSERYALPFSTFMFHGARAGTMRGVNQFETLELHDKLVEMDSLIWAPLKAILGNDTFFDTNFKEEKIIPVLDLAKEFPRLLRITGTITIVP